MTDKAKDKGFSWRRLFVGVGFVLGALLLWWLFMLVTWIAGRGFVWVVPPKCDASRDGGFWDQLIEVVFGHVECGALSPIIASILLVVAIWVAGRAFFPPSYPPEA